MTKMVFYKCKECGNVVAILNEKGGAMDCCGQTLTKLEVKTADEGKEKHVPVVIKDGDKIKVEVGSVMHPMKAEHYIQWIALESEGKMKFCFLEPGEDPKAEFEEVNSGTVYEYCNLHGLWKMDF